MAQFSNKHGKRMQDFFIKTFSEGLNQEKAPQFLPATALSRCNNMKYSLSKTADGAPVVQLQQRQGTEKISSTALASAVLACTYYVKDAHYITATATKVYELNDSTFAQTEIGTISGRPTFSEFHDKLIVHDSGVTKAWNGTTFETLTCLYQNEVIGTGNNATVAFNGTLSHPAVKVGSLTITYTDTTAKTIVDDGDGTLSGDGTGTINYTTGAWAITASGAPDSSTSIYANYEMVDGAPKTKAGLVRASRLYAWGSSDYPSRLFYTAPNDEDGWDTSSGGGYLDVDPLDGYSIIGCINFFSMVIVIKGNSLYRIDNFPGDSVFRVVPLMQNIGSPAYQTCITDGKMVSFLSAQGVMGITASDLYGDISKTQELSRAFHTSAVLYANSNAYSEYNQHDQQLWLTLYNGNAQADTIYVISMETGGQLTLYNFSFGHTCYKFVNREMLIGGSDGNLYRLSTSDSNYLDNGVSYSADTNFRTAMLDWNMPLNRKHNKRIYAHCYGASGLAATLNVYTDGDFATVVNSTSLSTGGGHVLVWELQSIDVFDMTSIIGIETIAETSVSISKKFNYQNIMLEMTGISGQMGVEIYGFDLNGAVIGH